MPRLFLLFSSIFLTSFSAWSQDSGLSPQANINDAVPYIEVVDVIDLRGLPAQTLNLRLQSEFRRVTESPSAVELVRENLRSQDLGYKGTGTLIIQDNNEDGSEYSGTLLAVGAVGSYYHGQNDKGLHAAGGAGIALATQYTVRNAFKGELPAAQNKLLSNVLGVVNGCFVGLAKEKIFDRNVPNHSVDKRDFYATCAGGAGIMLGQLKFKF